MESERASSNHRAASLDPIAHEIANQRAAERAESGLPWRDRLVTFDERRMRRETNAADDPLGLDTPGVDPLGLYDETFTGNTTGVAPWARTLAERLLSDAEIRESFESLVRLVSGLGETARAMAKLLEPYDWTRLQWRRHGAASVCPQHGSTIGGLCRSCARRRSVSRETPGRL